MQPSIFLAPRHVSYAAVGLLPLVEKTPDENNEFEALLLGYIALNNANNDGRWITVVANKTANLQHYRHLLDLKNTRLRIIQAEADDILWISWQCLAQGNSQAVITVIQAIDSEQRGHLMDAATRGESRSHLICVEM